MILNYPSSGLYPPSPSITGMRTTQGSPHFSLPWPHPLLHTPLFLTCLSFHRVLLWSPGSIAEVGLGFKTLLPQLPQGWDDRPVSPMPPCSCFFTSSGSRMVPFSLIDTGLLYHWMVNLLTVQEGSLHWGILAEHWILVTFLFSCFPTTLPLLWKKHKHTMIHVKLLFWHLQRFL